MSSMYLSEVKGQGGIEAKCVAASVTEHGDKIYTLETKAPKFIDAEFEKHRMLSSNSSSSRAIPFQRPSETYLPFDVRKKQKGMQGDEPVDMHARAWFRYDVERMLNHAFAVIGYHQEQVHKQHLNRYIEPWLFQKKVVTATEWDNFFRLRLAPGAQPEIQELARCMQEAMNDAPVTYLKQGEWHLPYIDQIDAEYNLGIYKKCSVARCARVSYMNHDSTNPVIQKDIELYDMLLADGHMSPFEHQATPMVHNKSVYYDDFGVGYIEAQPYWQLGITHVCKHRNYWSGNFKGWIQNRQLIEEWNS